MNKTLAKVVRKAEELPPADQEALAQQWLEDLEGERGWDKTFSESQDQLKQMADDALREFKEGKTQKGGFDEL